MERLKLAISTLSLTLLLHGCSNPYALNINEVSYSKTQIPGSIKIPNPKEYPRAYLIEERKNELLFLVPELEACSKLTTITPIIVRDLEQIRAASVGLGLSFDPAKAFDYDANKEIADLKNDIATTKLEMTLQKLQREAEILKDTLAAKKDLTETINTDSISNSSLASVSSNAPAAADVAALLGKIDTLTAALKTNTLSAMSAHTDKVDPIELFNYKRACRDVVKSAINKAKLDTLHDYDGNALVRFQFQPTSLPPKKAYNDTVGIMRLEVKEPDFNNDQQLVGQIYANWLKYVNSTINDFSEMSKAGGNIRTNPKFYPLEKYYNVMYVQVPRPGGNGKISLGISEVDTKNNLYYRIALPKSIEPGLIELTGDFSNIIEGQLLDVIHHAESVDSLKMSSHTGSKQCDIKSLSNAYVTDNGNRKTLREAAFLAVKVKGINDAINLIAQEMALNKWASGAGSGLETAHATYSKLTKLAIEYLTILQNQNQDCSLGIEDSTIAPPPNFIQALAKESPHISVYEISPEKKIQAVSTAARASDALVLAASIAANMPGKGIGANLGSSFSQSAVGKADALEISPIVVGFAEPGRTEKDPQAFGWVLGPRAVLDGKNQELKFIQPLESYSLFVDLSVPGWWPEIKLKSFSAWAPDWQKNAEGKSMNLTSDKFYQGGDLVAKITNTYSDQAGLTDYLLRTNNQPVFKSPKIGSITPGKIHNCSSENKPLSLQIRGDNIWRASKIFIDGKEYDTTAISLLPDMQGVSATINIDDIPLANTGYKSYLQVDVSTPDGFDTYQLPLINSCEQRSAVVVSSVVPKQVTSCDSQVNVIAYGDNLTADSKVFFAGTEITPVKSLPRNKGLQFAINLSAIPKSALNPLLEFKVVNKYGEAPLTMEYYSKKVEEKCVASDAVAIFDIYPPVLNLCSDDAKITLIGQRFSDLVAASIASVKANDISVENDSTAVLTFKKIDTASIPKSATTAVLSLRTKTGVFSKTIPVNQCQ
ncbi:hypothetical protein D0C16_06370 [Cellvibrio sp. KY-GH-1]|uniref:hypothetical protein n=1 Tax=Cellvibrio sp. KY-GH-1 TaxID=2303332 RepID=UPI0012448540|nr:hypothetical protein [Cellvibrio sp. KY-GH-1]QEY15625.1 hypothetical protein D0C16_06370 [Cellvibrio sp. KY-GH-1]